MFTCPHCKEQGIGFWSKLWSGSDTPSTCSHCGQLSYVHSKYRFGMQTAWPTVVKLAGITASLYLLFLTNSVYVLILIPVIWGICSFWELASLPMLPITASESRNRKTYGNNISVVVDHHCANALWHEQPITKFPFWRLKKQTPCAPCPRG